MGANGFQPIVSRQQVYTPPARPYSTMARQTYTPAKPPPAFSRNMPAAFPGLMLNQRHRRLPPVREAFVPASGNFADYFKAYLGVWTGRLGLAKVADRLSGRDARDLARQSRLLHPAEASPTGIFSHGQHSYSGLLKLNGSRDMTVSMLAKPGAYLRTVSNNFRPLLKSLSPVAVVKNLAAGKPVLSFGLKEYLSKTVWTLNSAPIRRLLDIKAPGLAKISLQGAGHLFGVGWYAMDAVKAGKKAFETEKKDHATGMTHWLAAGRATAERGVKNAVAWEAAGAGFAIGRAVLPGFKLPRALPGFGGGYVPLGGYVLGSLLGSAVYLGLTRQD